jgi:HEAT repeat protein
VFYAVNALGSVKNPRVASALLEMLNDPEREVQKQVILTLGELKDGRTLPALQEIASQRADRKLHTLAKDTINKIS